jgi:hypothetical protein
VGSYTDVFTGETVTLAEGHDMRLAPWEYKVYVK